MVQVSVIIPIYNVEKYIEECLRSVLNQTLKDIEIICVNDGTLDNSMKIVEKYAQQDDRIVILHKENGGLSSARNAGLKVAKGEYIYFLDSDDYILENALECLYSEMSENNLDSVFFDADSFYESEELEQKHTTYKKSYHRPEIYGDVVTGAQLVEKMAANDHFKPSACLQMNRTSLLKENNILFKEGIIHEDNLFTIQTSMAAKRVKHIAKAFYQRRVRENSIMTARTAKGSVYGYLLCIEGTLKEILNYGTEEIRRVYIPQLRRMRNVAVGALKKLPEEEFAELKMEASSEAQILYEFVIKDYAEMTRKKDKKIASLKKRINKLETENEKIKEELQEFETVKKELEDIKNSKAYKIKSLFTR